MYPYYAALIAGIVLGVAGQIALKLGAEGSQTIALQFRHPATIIGFAIYVVAAVLYMISLKKIPLSLANPSVSVSYVAVAIAAHFMWSEPFGLQQIGALVLIGGGAASGPARNLASSTVVCRPRMPLRCGKRPKRATISRWRRAERRAPELPASCMVAKRATERS